MLYKTILATFVVIFFCLSAKSQTKYLAGQSYFGQKQYVEYLAGNAPLIVSAPHGGALKPTDIPDRNCTGCSYLMDANTQELARAIQEAVFQQWGCYPHVIINRLHRVKLDANRDIVEAADSNATAEIAWLEYHNFIDSAKATVTRHFGKGMFLDLHGHAHTIQRLELGYLLSKSDLQQKDSVLSGKILQNKSSYKNLIFNNLQNETHANLLRGDFAMGTLLAKKGFPAVPSQQDKAPLGSEDYFNGGYNTLRHGSNANGAIDGFQIECNFTGVRDNAVNRKRFADSLTASLKIFMQRYYFNSFPSCKVSSENYVPENKKIITQPVCNSFSLPFEVFNKLEIKIFDLQGRLILGSFIENNNIQLPDNLIDGIYLLEATGGQNLHYTTRLLKKCF